MIATYCRTRRTAAALTLSGCLALSGCGSSHPPGRTAIRTASSPRAHRTAPAPRVVQRAALGPAVANTNGGHILGTDAVIPGYRALWVVNDKQRTLYKLNPKTLEVSLRRQLPARSAAPPVAGLGAVWIPLRDGYIMRLDPRTGSVRAEIRVGPDPRSALVAARRVWVSDHRDGMIRAIDPLGNRVAQQVHVAPGLDTLVSIPGALWATVENDSHPGLVELDRHSGRVLRRIATRETLYLAVAGGYADGTLWASPQSGGIVRLNPRTGRTVATINSQAFDVWTSGEQIWTTWPPDGEIQPINPRTNLPGRALKVGAEKEALGFGFGSLWAVDVKSSTLTRITQ